MRNTKNIWREHYIHPVPWDQDFSPLSVVEMVVNSATAHPDAVMLDFMGRKFSYGEMLGLIRKVAAGLQQMGIGKGDRVGLFLPNTPHYPAAYYGAMMAGATVVNFSPLYTAAELEHQVEDSGTKLLFTLSAKALLPTALEVLRDSSLERLVVGSVAEMLPSAKSLLYKLFKRGETAAMPTDPNVLPFADLTHQGDHPAPVAIDPDKDIALLQYTGGTTGRPKGAMLSH
ncbi:MAG: AMP-binding protein, partial [Sphingobium sp.]